MAASQLRTHLTSFRARLLQHESQASAAIEQAYAHTLAGIQPRLDKLYTQMVNELGNGDKIPISWLYEAGRMETLKRFVAGEIDHFGALSLMTAGEMQRIGVQLGQQAGMALLQASVPPGVRWSFGVPSPQAIAQLVGMTQAGSPLADLFHGFGAEAAQKVGEALVRGVTLGDNPRKVAREVQDALGVSRARALTISRTEGLRCYRSANAATFRANADTLNGWSWSCALDSRCCGACVAMNGTTHDLSEDMASHVNCRCAMIPLSKGWDDILGPLGINTDTIPDTTYQPQSGSDWFDNQDEATQKSILGPSKYAAWKEGQFKLSDVVAHDHDPKWGTSIRVKSLKELVKT